MRYYQLRINLAVFFLASLLVFSLAGNSQATIIGAQSTGDELAGGKIKVTFAQQGVRTAPIVAGLPGEGMASLLGFFSFSTIGDTFFSDWRLRNDTTFDTILSVEFDLSGTTSPGSPAAPGPHSPGVLFDDGSSPSTANGYAGRAGAVQVNAGTPAIINSFEVNPWLDPMNAGDEFLGQVIEYRGFEPSLISVWRDDTDIVGVDTGPEVPEPKGLALATLGVALLAIKRKRRSVA